MSIVSTNRNTVVAILGWLGAHPKSLLRYESLYIQMGLNVTSINTNIAPPYTIVRTILTPNESIVVPTGWPNHNDSITSTNRIDTTQDIAWNILKFVHQKPDCDKFYVHAFSNGGCFVWEKIRQILLLSYTWDQNNSDNSNVSNSKRLKSSSNNNLPSTVDRTLVPIETLNILSNIREKLRGVIFDSCPIADLYRLPDALQMCTMKQRTQVIRHCGYEYQSILTDPITKAKVEQRINNYIRGLIYDPLPVHQLYLYSRDDTLAPSTFIDTIIEQRKKFISNSKNNNTSVVSLVWDHSKHCAHHHEHPLEYHNVIARFVHQSDLVYRIPYDRSGHIQPATPRSKL